MTRTFAAALLTTTMAVAPASAEETVGTTTPSTAVASTTVVPARVGRAVTRPAILPALYASTVALQAYDVYSTKQALARGAQEANPLMQGVVGNTGALIAVKGAVTAGTILAAERLWHTNKPAAIAVLVASNSVAALVAARNARTLRQLK